MYACKFQHQDYSQQDLKKKKTEKIWDNKLQHIVGFFFFFFFFFNLKKLLDDSERQ